MELALNGIIIGLSLGAPIGPINVEIVRRGLRSGFFSGWLVGAGAITGDTLYCLLVIAGVVQLVDHHIVRLVLWVAGAAFLAFLGYASFRGAFRAQPLTQQDDAGFERQSFTSGLLMALLNPMGIAFWLSIGGAAVASGVEHAGSAGTVMIVVGVILGLGLWVTTLSALVHGGRRFVTDRFFRVVNLVSSLLLFGFAVWFAREAVLAVM